MANQPHHPSVGDEAGNLHIPVDKEHAGIRSAGCAIFAGVTLFSYLLISVLLPQLAFLGAILALVIGAGATHLADRQLKARWPSGRFVNVREDGVHISRQGKLERGIDPQKQTNVLLWYFEVPRATRVPKGWYVIACALEQDGTMIPTYTFCPPDEFDKLPLTGQYVKLMRKKEVERAESEREMRLAGQQRRLHTAEYDRSLAGAEMERQHFEQYLRALQERFAEWMPRDERRR